MLVRSNTGHSTRDIFSLLICYLFSTGITDENHLSDLTGIFVESSISPHSPPISLHTFGYGPEPDSKLLMRMARATPGGSFYSVRDNSQIASAFGDAIGGILSVVAQQVTLSISVPDEAAELGAKIIAVHHDKTTEITDGVFQVALDDMYAEETRDIIFEVSLVYPKTSAEDADNDLPSLFPHSIVELSYFDTIKHVSIGPLLCTTLIARPYNDYLGWPNCYVAIQWMRVRTAKVIADAWQLEQIGDLDLAKQKLTNWIEEFNKEKFEIGSEEPLLEQLLVDLNGCLGMLKKTNYDAYVENELGVRMQVSFGSIYYFYPILASAHLYDIRLTCLKDARNLSVREVFIAQPKSRSELKHLKGTFEVAKNIDERLEMNRITH